MKRTLFFMLLSAWLFAPAAWAYDFETDGICYNITSSNDKTVEVAYYSDDKYSGDVTVTIPETVTNEGIEYRVIAIGNGAFDGCWNLTSVTIPNSVTAISNYAFEYCSGLTSVTIPDGVTDIGKGAFYWCKSLTSVTIPESVTTIGERAFVHCDSLTSVTIPQYVTTIGDGTFDMCNALVSVIIGAGVTTIGNYAFEGCRSLMSVTVYNPTLVNLVGKYVYYGVDCSKCTLYVPAESVELYKAAEGWKEFGTILPIDESSAITEIQQENADGHIMVYNLQGVPVLETDDAADLKTLQNGAYIVNGKTMIIAR